jgi:hypothetical protein
LANLLSRTAARKSFPALDPEQHARFESRFGRLVSLLASADSVRVLERKLDALEPQLEELESEASLVAASDLLEGIERARLDAVTATKALDASGNERTLSPPESTGGDLICYWPGRSLSTGEPNVASRGFFDDSDRPPVGFWLEAIARPRESSHEEFELAIIAWVPAVDADRARAGCRACTSGSLALLSDVSQELNSQLRSVLNGRSSER